MLLAQALKVFAEPDVLDRGLHDIGELLAKGDVLAAQGHVAPGIDVEALEQPGTGDAVLRGEVGRRVGGLVLVVAPGQVLADLQLVDDAGPVALDLLHVHALLVDGAGDDAGGRAEAVSDIQGQSDIAVERVPVQAPGPGVGGGVASVHAELDGVHPGLDKLGQVGLGKPRTVGDQADLGPLGLGVQQQLRGLGMQHGFAAARNAYEAAVGAALVRDALEQRLGHEQGVLVGRPDVGVVVGTIGAGRVADVYEGHHHHEGELPGSLSNAVVRVGMAFLFHCWINPSFRRPRPGRRWRRPTASRGTGGTSRAVRRTAAPDAWPGRP